MSIYHNTGDSITNGDCESTTKPLLGTAASVFTAQASFARSSDRSYIGSYSYKLTCTTGSNYAYAHLHEEVPDTLGLVVGDEYCFSCYMYVPSTNSVSLANSRIDIGDYVTGIQTNQASPTAYDEWQILSVSRILNSTATRIYCRVLLFDGATPLGDHLYVDQLKVGHAQDTPGWTPTRDDSWEIHTGNLQTQRALAVADGGIENTKYYGAGQYNFGDEEDRAEEFRIEFISKNGGTFTVNSY